MGHRRAVLISILGVDTDPHRAATLASGAAPFHDPGLDQLLEQGIRAGQLSFPTDIAAAAGAAVHFLCVAPLLVDGVGKSTVPVGTAAGLARWLRDTVPAGDAVRLASNPEFLREGHAVEDSLRPDRLVLGVEDDESDQVLLLREVYREASVARVPAVRTEATAELALGAAFKPGSDDLRDSPALAVVREPLERGVDLVLSLIEWEEHHGLEPVALAAVVGTLVVLDGRLALDVEKWQAAGCRVHPLEREGR